MSVAGNLLLLIAFLPVALALRSWFRESSARRRHGCALPPKRASCDPIFGLDVKVEDMKADGKASILYLEANYCRKLGKIWRDTSLMGHTFHSGHEKNIQAVLGLKSKDWGVQPFRHAGMKPFCGDGVLSTDGKAWERSRALFKPSFYKSNISDLSQFEHSFRLFLETIPNDGTTINLQEAISPVFVDTTTHFILGSSLGILDGKQPEGAPVTGEEFLHHFNLSTRAVGIGIFLGPLRHLLPRSFNKDHWDVVHKFVEFHKERESNVTPDNAISHLNRSLLQRTKEQTTNVTEIRDQLVQGFLGAMDTVTVLISNTMRFLSRHPDIWARLRAEVRDVKTTSLTIEEVRKLPFLRNILNETMRIHPVFPVLARDALTDTVLPTGGGPNGDLAVFAAAGSRITVNFWVLHREEAVFGIDPEKFNPDRWDSIQPGPWQFLPFGAGQRTCLGQNKALGEASCVLIRLAQSFQRVEARDDTGYYGELRLVARNVNGCKIGLIR